jgi:hypothetical protein
MNKEIVLHASYQLLLQQILDHVLLKPLMALILLTVQIPLKLLNLNENAIGMKVTLAKLTN